ncbi:glycosyltransferase [Salinimicrobium terrae]|uniref:glycosyltransferase n=1 Tax=Salinimicrobium terrae TaxID=470866 RepID=UPI000423F56D|nr:glycosyltransferase [Salinimicrobium terrae]
MTQILVSVFMLTYNQEEFIAQAIEGVLMQETSFTYQLVIGEDASSDRTRKICEEYAAANPEKIKLLPSYRNLGLINNFIRTYKECNGEYVAICDGDDYWTDPLKLQKQVDFLDSNPDYSIVFTSFQFLFPDGRFLLKDYKLQSRTTGFEDLVFENYICSATVLFRNKAAPDDFPDWLDQCPYGDWPIYLWTTKDGSKVRFIETPTAVYRREIGVSEKMKLTPSKIAWANLKIIENVKKDAAFSPSGRVVQKSTIKSKFKLLACFLRERKVKKAVSLSFDLLLERPIKLIRLYLYLMKKG